jgi:hypothetical protein
VARFGEIQRQKLADRERGQASSCVRVTAPDRTPTPTALRALRPARSHYTSAGYAARAHLIANAFLSNRKGRLPLVYNAHSKNTPAARSATEAG